MIVALGADHAGFQTKERLKGFLQGLNLQYRDFGANSPDPADYPDFAHLVAAAVSTGSAQRGILICGTGIGMAIVANKHCAIRAANIESIEAVNLARRHNDINVLTLGARLLTWDVIAEIVRTFLQTLFDGGRHERRVGKIHTLTSL